MPFYPQYRLPFTCGQLKLISEKGGGKFKAKKEKTELSLLHAIPDSQNAWDR